MTEQELDAIIEQDEQEQKFKDELNKEKNVLENVLKTDDGIKLLRKIIFAKCFVESTAYTNDVNATNFNLGRQSIGQELLSEIRGISEDYICKLIRTEKGE